MNKYDITTMKKKKAIVEASLSLFEEKGFSDVSIKEIAKQAKVSQVSIYNYFGNKEALVAECATIVMEDTKDKALEILRLKVPFTEKLIKALNMCTQSANISISKYFTETALSDPALATLLTSSINDIKNDIYREYIELGKKEKSISAELSTSMILSFLDALNTIEFSNEEEIAQIHRFFLYGIVGKVK